MPPFPGWSPGFLAAIERLAIADPRPATGVRAGTTRSVARGRALEFADYRPYTPGDDPALVDWRAYARLDRLYLKRYEEERARPVTLLLDASASLDTGDGDAHKGRRARQLAAAFTWVALGRLEPVQVVVLQHSGATPLPRVATRAAAASLFQRLGAQTEGGPLRLAEAVRAALRLAPAAGPLLLVSDLLDPSWPDAVDALGATSRGDGAVVQVLAPEEWSPALGEEVELLDAETGDLRATRLDPLELAAYADRLAAFLAEVRAACQRHGLRYAALDSAEPLETLVLRRLTAARVLA